MLTERTGGSDLAALETTASRDGDAWRLNGFKWFASNANGSAFVVLAKPEGAADGDPGHRAVPRAAGAARRRAQRRPHPPAQGQARHQGGRVGRGRVRRRRGVPAGAGRSSGGGRAGDGRGLARMMELTNGARLGIAMMGLGCARRALVESLCYAGAREAFGARAGRPAADAAQAGRADRRGRGRPGARVRRLPRRPRLRIGAPLIKLRAARLGITAASDAIEIHGGNGYIEQWPVARILRDAQVNTIWEGPDNILCLDVRRAIEREDAHVPFLDRLARGRPAGAARGRRHRRAGRGERIDAPARGHRAVADARPDRRPRRGCSRWPSSWSTCTPARCSLEQAGWERGELGPDRKALVARLYARAPSGRPRSAPRHRRPGRGARTVQGPRATAPSPPVSREGAAGSAAPSRALLGTLSRESLTERNSGP